MTFAVRGVIEGFYGRTWTWPERRRVASMAAEADFTTYVYAPKEDRLQNAGWRTPYPDDLERRLRELADGCIGSGMGLWMGLRPVGISYADDADLLLVLEKLRMYLDIGAERIVLLADDIPSRLDDRAGRRFHRLVDAHVWLIEQIVERLDVPPASLVFVPTDYHGFGTPYLEHLGCALPAEIDVCWTGSGVFAASIDADEAERVAAVLGRPPLIWDNYPVNDEHDRHELRIGPIRGRDPGLADRTRGILVNPALEPEATLVPLLTWGEFLADPDGYDAHDAWRRALLRVAGNERDAATVATIAAALDRSCIDQGWERPPRAAVTAAGDRLLRLRNRRLAADLEPFLATDGTAPR